MSADLMTKVAEVIVLKKQAAAEPGNIQVLIGWLHIICSPEICRTPKKYIDRALAIDRGDRNTRSI